MDHLEDRQLEFGGKFEIARVVSWNGHDRACAVAGQDVIGDPDRNLLVIDRIHRKPARKHSRFFLG